MKIDQVSLYRRFWDPQQLREEPLRPKIVFMGRSNVGKSSFINSLVGRSRMARVSGRPGKTVTVDYYLINESFFFVDLPGLGYARISKIERQRVSRLIRTFFEQTRNIRLLVLLVDCRREFGPAEAELLPLILEKNIKILTVLTKSDKLSRLKLTNKLAQTEAQYKLKAIPYSTQSTQNKKEILRLIGEGLKEKK